MSKVTRLSAEHRILIVDDDKHVRFAYRSIFEESSTAELLNELEELTSTPPARNHLPDSDQYRVDYAKSGEEAIEMAEEAIRKKHPYAVAFLDIRMPPKMNGVDAAKRLLDIDKNLHIAFISAYSDYTPEQLTESLGKDVLYFQKPINNDILLDTTRMLCNSSTNYS